MDPDCLGPAHHCRFYAVGRFISVVVVASVLCALMQSASGFVTPWRQNVRFIRPQSNLKTHFVSTRAAPLTGWVKMKRGPKSAIRSVSRLGPPYPLLVLDYHTVIFRLHFAM